MGQAKHVIDSKLYTDRQKKAAEGRQANPSGSDPQARPPATPKAKKRRVITIPPPEPPPHNALIFRSPTPNTDFIQAIHRSHDGWLELSRKNEAGKFYPIGRMQPQHLRDMFPQFIEQLISDSYVTINAFGVGRDRKIEAGSGRLLQRRTSCVRYVTSLFCDIDIGRPKSGMTQGQVLGRIHDLAGEGVIPPASVVGYSGRGIWFFWLLRDKDGGPLRVHDKDVPLWQSCMRALHERIGLSDLDKGVVDATRVTRVGGSINSKAPVGQNVVWHYANIGPDGRIPEYKLEDVAETLGVELARRKRRAVDPERSEIYRQRGILGAHRRAVRNLENLLALERLRGGFHEGHRGRALNLLRSLALSPNIGNHMRPEDVPDMVRRLAARCKPPFPEQEVEALLRSAPLKTSKLKNTTPSLWFNVTPEEIEKLPGWKSPTSPAEPPPQTRAERAKVRRDLILKFWRQATTPPTLTAIQRGLEDFGITAGLESIRRDLDALELINPRAHQLAIE